MYKIEQKSIIKTFLYTKVYKLSIFEKWVFKIGYVRFKVHDEMHKTIKKICKKLGLKESELSRMALMEYLRSMNVFEEKIKGGGK